MQPVSRHFIFCPKILSLFFLTLCFFAATVSVSITTILYLLSFLCLLFSGDWRSLLRVIFFNKAALSFWLIFGLFIAGLFYSTSTPHWMWQDFQKRHWLLMTPFFIALISEEKWRHRMITVFLTAMILTLLLSYLQFFLHFSLLVLMKVRTSVGKSSVFLDHIEQSAAMTICAFICGYRFLFGNKWKTFYAVIFLLMAIDILWLSVSRTGYVIFILILAYLCVIRFGWKGILCAIAAAIILFGIGLQFSSPFRLRMQQTYNHVTHYHQIHHLTSTGQRIEMMSIAKKMFLQKPWLGYGTGGIQTALPKIVPAKDRVYNPAINFVESIYANFLLEFGIVGFTIFLIAIFMQIKATFAMSGFYRYLMQAVLIVILSGGFFNAFLVSFPIAHLYALFSALCFSEIRP